MPTLLQINVTANSGSTGRIAEGIGQCAMSQGWRSILAYGQSANNSANELIRIGNNVSLKEHGLESRLFDRQGLASRFATKKFIDDIERLSPDIIHLHNIHGYYINYLILFDYLSKKRVPVVWTLHDCWSFTGHCAYFDYARCTKWKEGCIPPCPCKKNYPKSLLFESSRRNYDLKKKEFASVRNMTLVPVSNWLGSVVSQSFLSQYPVEVIHNGIDLDVFRPNEMKSELAKRLLSYNKRLVIGVASGWGEERKGLKDIIKLREILSDRFLIVLVGVEERLLPLLPKGIVGVERTQNQQELTSLYSIADVFLNPTYEDNYPTTNLEAMACGTPVITYKTGGSPEAVTPDTGWVVEQGDIEELKYIIEGLETCDENSSKMRRINCRKRAETEFDKNIRFNDYVELYNELLLK